jgi:TRAP-type mannitol/chloroaromatic compound transport system permease small subunit
VSSSARASTAREAPTTLDRLVAWIDGLSTVTGWAAGWLMVPMTLAVVYEVIARYAFNAPTIWAYDTTYMLFGAQFMLAASYTLLRGGHIRTDVFYEKWSPRTRAVIDTVSYVFFFFPGMLFVLYAGWVEATFSWRIGERSDWSAWRPIIYPLKFVIPLSAGLLLLQGFAELVRCLRTIRGGAR